MFALRFAMCAFVAAAAAAPTEVIKRVADPASVTFEQWAATFNPAVLTGEEVAHTHKTHPSLTVSHRVKAADSAGGGRMRVRACARVLGVLVWRHIATLLTLLLKESLCATKLPVCPCHTCL